MTDPAVVAEPPPKESSDHLTRKQIRGSGLLLSGRGVATGLKFLAKLMVVRYLSDEVDMAGRAVDRGTGGACRVPRRLMSARTSLSVLDTFPELGRSRLMRTIFG